MNILLVEDEPALRTTAAAALKLADYRVTSAADGIAALARVDESRPDLVVLDLHMPMLDGIGAQRIDRTDLAELGADGRLSADRGSRLVLRTSADRKHQRDDSEQRTSAPRHGMAPLEWMGPSSAICVPGRFRVRRLG